MAVRVVRFARARDRRAWASRRVTRAQRDRLFSLFGDRFRMTSMRPSPWATRFTVGGTGVWVTSRGRVMSPEELRAEIEGGEP